MATAIGGTPNSRELVLDLLDYTGETARVSMPLQGATSDASIIAIIDAYIAATNIRVIPSLKNTFGFTGYATAGRPKDGTNPQAFLSSMLAMEFQATNPLNANAKPITKQVPLLGYLDALRNDGVKPHVPVTGNANFNNLVTDIAAALSYVGPDGVAYSPTWLFNPGSKFGTKLSVTDGL